MLSHTPAQRFSPLMDSVFDALRGRVADIPGANVEHNKFAVSVHFRNCDAADFPTVMEVLARCPAPCHEPTVSKGVPLAASPGGCGRADVLRGVLRRHVLA